MDLTLRPMSTSQILDRTFFLYRHNFVLFAGIAAFLPALVMVAQLIGIGIQQVPGVNAEEAMNVLTGLAALAFAVVNFVGYAVATGATVFGLSRVHLGNQVSIRECFKAVFSMTPRILGLVILIGLMAGAVIMVGFLFLMIPLVGFVFLLGCGFLALLLYCRYSLAVPACVLERLPVSASLTRSKYLAQGALWRILLVYLLTAAMSLALETAFSTPTYIASFLHSTKYALALGIGAAIAAFVSTTLATPVGIIAISLLYYDQRVRKEAFDLQLMMQALEGPVQGIRNAPAAG
ncbi:MAG TPA: hypothetical protein VN176_06335 [Verrucomicrobiae bacterium]|jgi:hypothetical protein|nr:hypothetical protein [Verrucomicrobiae bacterium]